MNAKPKTKRRPGRPKNPISREEILTIARRAFGSSGYAGASMGTIAKLAGLSKASLFYHFPSKDELYLSTVNGIISDLKELVLEAKLQEGDFVERIDRLGTLVQDYLGTHRESARILLREIIDQGPFIQGSGSTGVKATMVATTAFLSAGMSSGTFVDQDTFHLAISIVSIHLLHYAAYEELSKILGDDLFTEEQQTIRKQQVLAQIRRLCGIGTNHT